LHLFKQHPLELKTLIKIKKCSILIIALLSVIKA